MALRRPVSDVTREERPSVPSDHDLQERCPVLFDYLTSLAYEDGTQRQTASLIAFVEEGQFKVCLNDRDTDRVLFVSGDTLQETLDVLEAVINDDRPPWRESKGAKGRPPGKRKS